MMAYVTLPDVWMTAITAVLQGTAHRDFVLPKAGTPHPRDIGMKESVGEPQGQLADYRMPLPDGKSIHVREYEWEYRLHWDTFHPAVDWVNHLRYDAPHWWIILTVAVGGIIGCVASEDRAKGFICGAVCGLAFGLITSPSTG